MLWHLPLEPFEKRYTADWYNWFATEYNKNEVAFTYIDGEKLTEEIETGRFLDIYGTAYWKMTQMAKVAGMFRSGEIRDGDKFLTCDLWHPGIELIGYMAQLSGIKVKVYGILHAGTYDPHDFLAQKNLTNWARWHELGWIAMCEKVFVSTFFHKQLLTNAMASAKILDKHASLWKELDSKVVVTGLPFYPNALKTLYEEEMKSKTKTVVFPSRLDPEKDVYQFREAMKIVLAKDPSVNVVETARVCKTKDEYYKVLAGASVAVSTSWQETFGYAMLEAAALGCSIIVPNRLSYPEMYSVNNLYAGASESCAKKVLEFLETPRKGVVGSNRLFVYQYSIDKMLEEMEY